MKKLLIAFAAVAVAAGAQAAAFTWKTSMAGKVYNPGTETLLASATAYLFDTSVTQASLVTAFAAGGLDLSTKGSLSSASISSGAIASTAFSDGTAVGDTLTAYFAAIVSIDEKDYLFISATGSGLGQQGKSTNINISGAASKNAAMDVANGYAGAGWYTTFTTPGPTPGPEDVPEPTSGLLMLIGAAGLALRRKRA